MLTDSVSCLPSTQRNSTHAPTDRFLQPLRALTPVTFDIPAAPSTAHPHPGDPDIPFFGVASTPPNLLAEEMSALHKALHVERVVIVTPSVYAR